MIPALKKGDTIAIVAPAKAIEKEFIDFAADFFEQQGYEVVVGKNCLNQHHYFAGTDEERLSDFQEVLDNPEIKAIICARGGYGCVRIVDEIQWASLLNHPKWIVGFSDVTVFHQRINILGLPSIHGTMPLNFKENTNEALTTLLQHLEGNHQPISIPSHPMNIEGIAEGILIGGNLSILFSLLGTDDEVNFQDTILFIEDLAEQLYHLDRMLFAFKKAGVLSQIKGLIVGGMTDMKDTAIPFGKSLEEIIIEHIKPYNIPLVFGFPAGHINDNRALVFGKKIKLEVSEEVIFQYV
ncbi:MAG: LD-carboxypeptidase [Crocinitomicaceae bacterium]|jgi:muramoyltetrapeptide carboxypeptidase